MKEERTLVIIKHDGVMRGLIGEVIVRFERVGLKLVALEFLKATSDMGDRHYASSKENLVRFGNNTLQMCKETGIDPVKKYGTDSAFKIGKMIKQWNVDLITRGPVLAMVWQGPDAVNIVKKLAGPTSPQIASPGTIRGDFSWDNFSVANDELRSVYNVLHVTSKPEEAEYEIKLWFTENEIFDSYKRYLYSAMHKIKTQNSKLKTQN